MMSDSGDQARRLAASFAGLADQVEAYRDLHLSELTDRQQTFLDDVAQGLDDAHDKFTGIAIQETLDSIAGELKQLEAVTRDVKEALKHLNSVSEGMRIAAGLADLAGAIVTADYGAIPSAIKGIADAVANKTEK